MKLERLEELKKVSTKNLIVNEVLKGLEDKYYHNKFELEINIFLVLATLLGNTEMHEEMYKEDIDWIGFVNDNFYLLEELKGSEYSDSYQEIYSEILEGARIKEKYDKSFGPIINGLSSLLTEENVNKLTEMVERTQIEEKTE